MDSEFLERVKYAEQAVADGDYPQAFQRFQTLSEAIMRVGETEDYGFNESLVLHRFADVAVLIGRLHEAQDAYLALVQQSSDESARALAAFKRLDLAVTSGHGLVAQDAYRWIAENVWRRLPPDGLTNDSLLEWERTLCLPAVDRSMLLAHMCLAVGRLQNAQRRLQDSSRWFERGIHHAGAGTDPVSRLIVIPLLLALGHNDLTCGDLESCRSRLAEAAEAIAADPSGSGFQLWHRMAEVRLTLIEGRLAAVLQLLNEADTTARRCGQTLVVCHCLVSRAEVFLLLNLLRETDECLTSAEAFITEDDGHLRAAVERVRFLRGLRARGFASLRSSPSVREMMSAEERRSNAPETGFPLLDDTAVVWSGDCLTDYEIRETAVYANLDRAPADAEADLDDLSRDFVGTGSRLINARLHCVRGLLLSRTDQIRPAAEALEEACKTFNVIGAQRESYQATLFLARAYRHLRDERAEGLLAENDVRLGRLADGLNVEQRSAFAASKYSASDERQRLQMDRVLASKAVDPRSGWWSRLRAKFHFWLSLHQFICELDREQARRLVKDSTPASVLPHGALGVVRRLLFHPRNNLTVGFVVLPDQSFMYEIATGHLDCRIVDVGRGTVDNLQRALVGPAGFDEKANQMCIALGLQNVLSGAPDRVRSLTIVADATLHLVPFCALRYVDRHGAHRYLVERVALNLETVSTRRRRFASNDEGAAVVAHYNGPERALAAASPAADRAARTLRHAWRLKCREVDSKSACLAALPNANVFYYFGHGRFESGSPERSGIEFRGDGQNDILSLRDFDRLVLPKMEQALIFACETSDAVTFAGRWAVGLPQMLLRRGARSVLAAMWETDPDTAAMVSNRFLDSAVKVGRAEALRQVQLDLLGRATTGDPFWWAAFQLHGDGGRPVRRWRHAWL